MIILRLNGGPLRASRFLKSLGNIIQRANITGRGTRGCPLKLMKPFPYWKKQFLVYHNLFDSTMVRLSQENAKIIVVDGPVGAGKTGFAKILATELDMLHVPEANMDSLYLLPSGYDLRRHDHELPECVRSYDHKNFCLDPCNRKAGRFQLSMLFLRFEQYLNAMTHLLNTGQGVVLERSYFSDRVFMYSMYDQNFVSKAVKDAYFEVYKNTSTFFKPPHLIIYLDVPVPVVQERIRRRNLSYELNSPALTNEYLEAMERFYKQFYLKEASEKSEILVYDWSDGGDVELVVEDIEKIDFDCMRRDKKFSEWRISRDKLYSFRSKFTNDIEMFYDFFSYPTYKVPELWNDYGETQEYERLLARIPECKYDIGYNPEMGDNIFKILWGGSTKQYRRNRFFLDFDPTLEEK